MTEHEVEFQRSILELHNHNYYLINASLTMAHR